MDSVTAEADVSDLVTGRPGTYFQSYRERLLRLLKSRYPILLTHCGEQVFDLFALSYIHEHPSMSHSLFDFGSDFPEYLDHTRPADAGPVGLLPSALATLDQTYEEQHG